MQIVRVITQIVHHILVTFRAAQINIIMTFFLVKSAVHHHKRHVATEYFYIPLSRICSVFFLTRLVAKIKKQLLFFTKRLSNRPLESNKYLSFSEQDRCANTHDERFVLTTARFNRSELKPPFFHNEFDVQIQKPSRGDSSGEGGGSSLLAWQSFSDQLCRVRRRVSWCVS